MSASIHRLVAIGRITIWLITTHTYWTGDTLASDKMVVYIDTTGVGFRVPILTVFTPLE